MVSQRQKNFMGALIRQQREMADLSMRQVSTMVGISNPYLSQIERGLRAPSEAVAAGLATALGMSVEELYDQGAEDVEHTDLLTAIEGAEELTPGQRDSLAEIYRSFVRANAAAAGAGRAEERGSGAGPVAPGSGAEARSSGAGPEARGSGAGAQDTEVDDGS